MQTEDKIFVPPNTDPDVVAMEDMVPFSLDSLMRSLGTSNPSRPLSSRSSRWLCSRRGACTPSPPEHNPKEQ